MIQQCLNTTCWEHFEMSGVPSWFIGLRLDLTAAFEHRNNQRQNDCEHQ
jgi:hypothetical protein